MTQCTLLDCPYLIDNIIWKNIRSHLYICWGDKRQNLIRDSNRAAQHRVGSRVPYPQFGMGQTKPCGVGQVIGIFGLSKLR